MSEHRAYWNGGFIPQSQLAVPFSDAGFIFGATVTDLCRTVRHQLYRWPDHLARFRRGCRAAHFQPWISDEELTGRAAQLVAHNAALLSPEQDLALLMFATPGTIGYYAGEEGGAGDAPPTFGMHTFPLPFARYRRLFSEGAHLVIPATRHVPSVCVDPRVKQRSRMHWWLADKEARSTDPHASALLLDLEGHVTETASANFLIARGSVVMTPSRHRVLNGVSLQVVEELCRTLGISFKQGDLSVDDCLSADEAMLSSTPYCLAGVSRINRVAIPWPGPIFKRLLQAWSEQIGLDIEKQIVGEPLIAGNGA